MIEVRRFKTCGKKRSFTSAASAKKVALIHNQSVYECPICFCFHTTSRKDWKDEFVAVEKLGELKTELIHKEANIKRLGKLVLETQKNLQSSKQYKSLCAVMLDALKYYGNEWRYKPNELAPEARILLDGGRVARTALERFKQTMGEQ